MIFSHKLDTLFSVLNFSMPMWRGRMVAGRKGCNKDFPTPKDPIFDYKL